MYLIIHLNISGGICYASIRYARANNKVMVSLYDPRQPSSYIMEVHANKLNEGAMSYYMQDGNFESVSQDNCRDIRLLLNYADGRIAIFDSRLFDHRENKMRK